jgi:ABC-type multidrug transport system fused ATPase/permease subunit
MTDMTASSSSPYQKTAGEKILLIFGWILIAVGAFLVFFLASGIFTILLFLILIVVGFIMRHFANRRVKQLKRRR